MFVLFLFIIRSVDWRPPLLQISRFDQIQSLLLSTLDESGIVRMFCFDLTLKFICTFVFCLPISQRVLFLTSARDIISKVHSAFCVHRGRNLLILMFCFLLNYRSFYAIVTDIQRSGSHVTNFVISPHYSITSFSRCNSNNKSFARSWQAFNSNEPAWSLHSKFGKIDLVKFYPQQCVLFVY